MLRLLLGFAVVASSAHAAATNTTASWLAKRAALIHDVYGKGPGVLPTQSVPDKTLTWPEDTDPRSKGLQGLVWNISNGMFPITSTVFYSPASGDPTKRSKTAFMFHHGHSNCVCPMKKDDPVIVGAKCRPGCNSSMPSLAQPVDQYTWWDLYNVSTEFHAAGHDVFILSMPLKGINLGPGTTDKLLNSNHWWFLQWEQKGDAALRYFLEPAVLTANYAEANGYEDIYMAGLSGGGWSTTFASAIDKRIDASFPIAGSTPCSMRNPLVRNNASFEQFIHQLKRSFYQDRLGTNIGKTQKEMMCFPQGIVNGQNWTGDDDEDFEQSCRPNTGGSASGKGDAQPGRAAFSACNYTCQYLLAGLEPKRFQVQILHEYDTCCFSPHNRHDGMLQYESNIRQELQGGDRKPVSGHNITKTGSGQT